ncbi:MAG: hypothetical protein AAGI68_17130 [Planctomycetota bacterium]
MSARNITAQQWLVFIVTSLGFLVGGGVSGIHLAAPDKLTTHDADALVQAMRPYLKESLAPVIDERAKAQVDDDLAPVLTQQIEVQRKLGEVSSNLQKLNVSVQKAQFDIRDRIFRFEQLDDRPAFVNWLREQLKPHNITLDNRYPQLPREPPR